MVPTSGVDWMYDAESFKNHFKHICFISLSIDSEEIIEQGSAHAKRFVSIRGAPAIVSE